jgi:hypothetical protein
LVNQDRRHLLVTPCPLVIILCHVAFEVMKVYFVLSSSVAEP